MIACTGVDLDYLVWSGPRPMRMLRAMQHAFVVVDDICIDQ